MSVLTKILTGWDKRLQSDLFCVSKSLSLRVERIDGVIFVRLPNYTIELVDGG